MSPCFSRPSAPPEARLAALFDLATAALSRLAGPPPDIPVAARPARSAAERAALVRDFVDAYADDLIGADAESLHWRGGARTPLSGAAGEPAILDIFAWDYPLGASRADPPGDPGRVRPVALFTRLWGDCHRGEVQASLVRVPWAGRQVRFSRRHGAALALAAVGRDLEALGPDYRRYLWPISGTFACRPIAGTRDPSMHAFGAAIDLSSRYGAYWRWRRAPGAPLPPEVVEAFERHGFIWGGKWAHFDSFHFEYRPEIIAAARRKAAGA